MRHVRRYWAAALGLGILFILLLVLATGPLTYQGDEWIVPPNIKNSLGLAAGLKAVADVPKRPLQLAHNALSYYVFDLHKIPLQILSGLLHLFNVAAFVAVIRQAFPKGNLAALVAGLLVFIVPAHMMLVFNVSFDGLQLAMMLYWGSVLALQAWILKSPCLSSGLWIELAIVCLVCSLLTYENAILLAPVTLGLVWLTGYTRRIVSTPRATVLLWVRVIVVVSASYVIWWIIRWFINTELLYTSYGFSLSAWLNNIIKSVMFVWRTPDSVDAWVIVGTLVALAGTVGLLWFAPSQEAKDEPDAAPKRWWILGALCAVGLLCFGILPYTLTGNVLRDNYSDGASRFYSSSIFGLALLVGLSASLVRPPLIKRGLAVLCVMYVTVQAAAIFSVRLQHQQLANVYRSLFRDLATFVPNTQTDAVFMIINAYVENARLDVVFFDLNAARTLYGPNSMVTVIFNGDRVTTPALRERSMRGISAQGYNYGPNLEPLSPDRLIILRREGEHLTLVETLTPADTTGLLFEWQDGITELHTNPEMILHDRDLVQELEAQGLLLPQP